MGFCIINIFDTIGQKPERKHSEVKIDNVDIEHEK
jgi:hypothetical protein